MSFADAFANMNKPKNEKFDKNQKQQHQNAQQLKKEEKPKEFKAKPNIGWLFYKDYFSNLTNGDYQLMLLSKEEKKQKKIEIEAIESKIDQKVLNLISQSFNTQKPKNLGNSSFELKTTYPGLLVGSGNTHELPDTKGQAILGFHFDYTSGLPEIAGSSIKGVLRSAFEHPEYIQSILDDKSCDVKKLELEIFGQDSKSGEVVAGKDIFFDAIITKGGKNNKILGDDFITPHKEATKNPIPLRFIKVLPEVTFDFRFTLQCGLITKEQKEHLFRQIIIDLGLGAKTNVGYGKFQEVKNK